MRSDDGICVYNYRKVCQHEIHQSNNKRHGRWKVLFLHMHGMRTNQILSLHILNNNNNNYPTAPKKDNKNTDAKNKSLFRKTIE